jgi:peptidase M23-like protein
LLLLLLVGVFAGSANAATVPAILAFPVVGNVHFINDFGAPRPQGPHQGIDIMSIRHQPAIAFETGRVEKHIGSSLRTCMLYLHGASGMTYVYIHLNNDLTMSNDNRGGCRNGVAYAPGLVTGQRVRRGQLVGYVGDSGDANGIQPHLHFEVRTPTGRAINPYRYLLRARHLLYPQPAALDPVSLVFRKARILVVGDGRMTLATRRIRVSSQAASYLYQRNVVLAVPPAATFERATGSGLTAARLSDASVGMVVRVTTSMFAPSWINQRAGPGVLSAGHVVLGAG